MEQVYHKKEDSEDRKGREVLHSVKELTSDSDRYKSILPTIRDPVVRRHALQLMRARRKSDRVEQVKGTVYEDEEEKPSELEFKLVQKIGEGGFGEVWKAQDVETGQFITVKYCEEEAVCKDLIGRIEHPNVTQILAAGFDSQRGNFVVREYVDGDNLDKELAGDVSLPYERFLKIANAVADAVAYLHINGVIHADIKPENVLVPYDIEKNPVKLTDFGLARLTEKKGIKQSMRTKRVEGTWDYIAPEVLYGEEPSMQSDVFSVGKLLMKMLTGKFPTRSQDKRLQEYAIAQAKKGLIEKENLVLAFDTFLWYRPFFEPDHRGDIEDIRALIGESTKEHYTVAEENVPKSQSMKICIPQKGYLERMLAFARDRIFYAKSKLVRPDTQRKTG